MGRALLELGSRYLLLILIGPSDQEASAIIQDRCPNCMPVEVEPIYKAVEFPAGWGWAYTKLRLWELNYEKVVFFDADVAIMKNVDSLFELPALSMARNRCGMCCSHAEGTAGTYSSGVMVLRPNRRDQARLHQALAYEWVGEHYLIQGVLPVVAELPDSDNLFTTEVLESCGCRPHERDDGSYVASLPVKRPFQGFQAFGGERIYFPGVPDAAVRTAHLHNPKPWLPNAEADVPCGGQFYAQWSQLLGRAMAAPKQRPLLRRNASTVASQLFRDAFTRHSCRQLFQHPVLASGSPRPSSSASSSTALASGSSAACRGLGSEPAASVLEGNGTMPQAVLELVASCPAGALRERLWAASQLLWSERPLTPSRVRAARRLTIRGFLAPLSSPRLDQKRARRLAGKEEACVYRFANHARRRLDDEQGSESGVAAVQFAHKLSEVVCSLPSCYEDKKRDCLLIEAVEMVKRFVSVGLHTEAEHLFNSLKAKGDWREFWQLPVWFSTALSSRPVWNAAADLPADDFIPRLVSAIGKHWREMFAELQALLASDPGASVAAYPELNRRAGNWTKVMLYDGDMGMYEHHRKAFHYGGMPYPRRKLHPVLCRLLPLTCSVVGGLIPGIVEPRLPYTQADQEQVNFFTLLPGSRVNWHSGASNGRLTIHTCLAGCGGDSFIQVGPERLTWQQGKPIVFDDSYLHFVHVDPALNEPRTILHVMVTHPQIDTWERFVNTKPDFVQPFWPSSDWEDPPG